MARLAGINIPDDKHTEISLTYIYGIGRTTAKKLCDATGISPNTKMGELTEGELDQLRSEIAKLPVEGDLRREVQLNIKRLLDLGCNEAFATDAACRYGVNARKRMRGHAKA